MQRVLTLLISLTCHFLVAVAKSSGLNNNLEPWSVSNQPLNGPGVRRSPGVDECWTVFLEMIFDNWWLIAERLFRSWKTNKKERLSLKYTSRLEIINQVHSRFWKEKRAYATSRNKKVFSLQAAICWCALFMNKLCTFRIFVERLPSKHSLRYTKSDNASRSRK